MSEASRYGVVLANVGTPEKPRPRAVRRYLARFLMDRRIAPMNRFAWWFVVHLFILPKRGRASAEKYRQIWTDEGSPFLAAHQKLARALEDSLAQAGVGAKVRCAMSYSSPTYESALGELAGLGCKEVVVLPLYPQSAHSTTGAVHDRIERRRAKAGLAFRFIDNYHNHPTYIAALAASIRHAGFDPGSEDRILFSYHSIPLSDIEAGDTYELQCGATSLHIAGELGIERTRWTIGYQCRFDKGREWLAPSTNDVLARWAHAGAARIFFVCPNFAVECLETLYDIDHVLKPYYFRCVAEAGGQVAEDGFVYVPCLDRSRAHLKVLSDIVTPYLKEQC